MNLNNKHPSNPSQPPRLPSKRVSAALAAAMLGVGIAIGAAIGPAPESSLAVGAGLPQLLPYLARAAQGPGAPSTSASSSNPAINPIASPFTPPIPAATPAPSAAASAVPPAKASGPAPEQTSPSPSKPSPSATTKGKSTAPSPTRALPKIAHVWLITLSSGGTFANALASPADTPFLHEGLLGQGTLLTNYSAPASSELASVAAALSAAGEVSAISEPPCPATEAPLCTSADSSSGLARADDFLGEVVPEITASPAYSENGLLVITFGAISQGVSIPGATPKAPSEGSPSSPASDALTTTLSAHPPAGAFLLSPLVQAGTKVATSFDPLDPRKSLERIFGS